MVQDKTENISESKTSQPFNKSSGKLLLPKRLLRSQWLRAGLAILVAVFLVGGIAIKARAENYPGGTDNGLTSNFLSLYNTLTTDGYGSPTNTPDWGTKWNVIATAAQWTPSANATASDVISGDTYYGNSRTQSTGTYPAPSSCSTEAYQDNYTGSPPVTQTTNCTANVTWTVPGGGITGTDHQDPRTGVIWSQCLANSSGTVTFVSSGCGTWSWDASGTNNVAVGNETAIQLCSGMGNGWRTPTQKELMQAYIDGSYFNLSTPSANFWSATQASSTSAWNVSLSGGNTDSNTFATLYDVRCVR